MKNYTNKIYKSVLFVLLAVMVGVTAVYAVDKLTAPSTPTKTMHSLSDIYTLIDTGSEASPISSIYQAPSTVGETMYTLEQIYTKTKEQIDLMKANNADQILAGNTFFGVEGTATSGPATLVWQADPALTLCWSYNQYEIDNGCIVGSGFTQTPDTTTLGAVEYCKYLNTDGITLANTEQNIWHLPTPNEFASITDYTKYNNATNVTGFVKEGWTYWSSSEDFGNTNYAWGWDTYDGSIDNIGKSNKGAVRCVR